MTDADTTPTDDGRTVHAEYPFDVRVVAVRDGGETRYRFEAPNHVGAAFDDAEAAELYADVYFDVNGFVEAGTGERGIPPEVMQAGKDTMAAYLLTRPDVDVDWVASFYGRKPSKIERYVEWVRNRAAEIRDGAADRGLA
ncbi:MAG: hypothetical protein ABEJ79_00870 [Halolamina sp.]